MLMGTIANLREIKLIRLERSLKDCPAITTGEKAERTHIMIFQLSPMLISSDCLYLCIGCN